ncbi:MAG: GHKL domain-containing protein [Treponema sp.]|jgi:hypothetical protein|nr:GHKL domain-containing protein [Treponema sp.]
MITVIALLRYLIMWLFGAALTVSFAGMTRTRKNYLVFGCFIAVIFVVQIVCGLLWGVDMARKLYPLTFHAPLVVFIALYLKRPPLISVTSFLLTFLCYMPPRWIGSFTDEVFSVVAMNWGGVSNDSFDNSLGVIRKVVSINQSAVLNNVTINHLGLIAGAVLTFIILKKFAVKPVQRMMNRSVKSCLLLGVMPFFYYLFDLISDIYTGFIYSGNRAVVQFKPSFLAVFNLVFILIYHAVTQKQAKLQRDHDMLDMQFRLAQNEFASLRQMQKNAAAYRHDMRHHLAVIQGLASSEPELREYLRTALSDMDAITPVRFCKNETVNLILSAYAGKAKQAEITLTIEAKLPDEVPFSDTEICSLLSNGLENALHACKNIPEKEKRSIDKRSECRDRACTGMTERAQSSKGIIPFINLRMYSKNNRLNIDISNSFQTEPVFENDLPVTQEPGHGFGTKSMAHIVEKHGGMCKFFVEDGRFVFMASV